MKNFSSISSIALAILASAFMLSCSRARSVSGTAAAAQGVPPVAVRAVPAVASDVPLDAAGIGNVEAVASVDVKARVTAPIIRVHFAEGDDVKQGEPLFDLDPETWNRQIAELEADVAKDTAAERQAQANIAKDQATLKNAQSVAERGAQLLKDGIFSREQTDQVVSTADAAKASLEADQAALESARAEEGADRARLAQTRLQLTFTTIAAPISGRAGAIQVKSGNIVKENDTTLVTILQTTPIYVSFSVPEDVLPQVRRYNEAGPLAVTATTADGSTATGTLKFIDNTVDVTTGTIRLKALFDNPRRLLWPGQFINVRARLDTEHGRVVVPSRTIQTGPQGKYVWVINPDSTAVMKTVEVLRNYTPAGKPEEAVIGSGLEPGQQVVSEGQLRLAPGARVQLLPS